MLMELRQLEYFVAVAEEANFTRAARRVHVAQPAVSTQVARLERELGQQLLDRSRREVRLTAAGEAVLPYARAALTAVHDARLAVEELGDLVRGSVAIGTVTAHNVDMPALLAAFSRTHPAVEITLGTDDSDALIDGVQSGRLDLVIASVGSGEVPDGLSVEVTTDESIEAVVGEGRPVAEPVVGSGGGTGRTATDRPARRHRYPPQTGRGVRGRRRRGPDRVRGEHPDRAR